MSIRTSLASIFLCLLAPLGVAQKKPLDHSVYDSWKTIRGTSFSHDGKWILYVVAPQEGDSKVEVKSVSGDGKAYDFLRGGTVQFSYDSKFVVATIVPPLAEVKKAQKNKVAAADMPKNSLLILNLATGEQTKIDQVTSFQLPSEDCGWFTYRPEVPKPAAPAVVPAASGANAAPARAGGTGRRGGGAGRAGGASAASSSTGAPLVIRNLVSGKEEKLENVGDAALSKDGTTLAYTVISKDGKDDGVYWTNLRDNTRKTASKGKAKVAKIALSDETKALAFLSDKTPDAAPAKVSKPAKAEISDEEGDVPEAAPAKPKKTDLALYLYNPKTDRATKIAGDGTAGIPNGWIISDNSALSFSEKGTRILFGTVPKPPEEKKDDTPDNEKVSVDVWNWQDKRIMPQQILQAAAEQKRSHQAIAFIDSGRVTQLETELIPTVTIAVRGEGEWALGSSDIDYRLQASWDADYNDYYIINLKAGSVRPVATKSESRLSFSPDGKYLFGYDGQKRQYFVIDPASLKRTDFKIPTALYNELEDTPSTPSPYGEAGWTKDDARLLVYDASDIWSIDPTGKNSPTNLTGGSGRLANLHFRYLNLDPEAHYVDLSKPILLSGMNPDTKAAGYFSLNTNEPHPQPKKLLFGDKLYSVPLKAKTGDLVSFTQQDFVEFPDVWVAKPDFSDAKKLSNANPQQAQYNWGSAELVNWISADGQKLQGILIKPEDFSYGKKYPMITYFYERLSDSLNSYHPPAPSASTVNLSYFASNGYVMFVPDIPYKTGYPGESSMSAIVSGVLNIVNRGYVDPAKLGIQGQSWGGYEVAYLVTQTNLFNCACSGAAVADMFSAYGGIRYGTGILREGQYEHGQSRIGGSIWEKPLQYLENSPLFWLDKVKTPLLMMHNDKDGAVPFTQGIELFSGLRRLGKPAWMVSYNGEDHNLVERKNRKDWSIRLSQYFDYYLKGAPMPVWMSKGVPAIMKGKTMGEELEPTPIKKS
jgi:dipeptidyl aminopeptidase/acylaminoacyl peptidase